MSDNGGEPHVSQRLHNALRCAYPFERSPQGHAETKMLSSFMRASCLGAALAKMEGREPNNRIDDLRLTIDDWKVSDFSRTGGYRTIFSAGVRTLSQSLCSCRPTPGARMLFVFYPGVRRRGLRLRLRPPRSRVQKSTSKTKKTYFPAFLSGLCRPLAALGALVMFCSYTQSLRSGLRSWRP